MPRTRGLTGKQRRFVEAYVYGEKAWEVEPCAQLAGYAAGCGGQVIRSPKVQEEIRRLIITRQVKWNIEQNDLENVLAKIAFDPRESGKGGPSNAERIKAVMSIAAMRGYLIERHEHGVSKSLVDLLTAAKDIEKSMPPAEVPLRLLQGGKAEDRSEGRSQPVAGSPTEPKQTMSG